MDSVKPKKTIAKKSSVGSVGRKTNGKKSVRDPNAPKRAVTAFLLFSNDKRQEIRQKNPKMKVTDISKELGKLWKEANDEMKAVYHKRSEEDKKRYERELQDFQNKH